LHRLTCAGLVHRAYNVHLVILPGVVAAVDLDDVVGVEHRVGGVPVDVVHPCGVGCCSQVEKCENDNGQTSVEASEASS